MSSTADALSQLRPKLVAMVAREERIAGSRMAAYERVASMIGRSPAWIQKALRRDEDIGLARVVSDNIVAVYERLCGHVEAAAAARSATVEAEIAAAERDFGADDRFVRAIRAAVAAALAVMNEDKP